MSENSNAVHYRQVLRGELQSRKEKNPRYSLRAYARDLDVLPSRLSEILSGKLGLSVTAAQKMTLILGLGGVEADLFVQSVVAHHARNKSVQKKAKKDFEKSFYEKNMVMISEETHQKVSSWLHYAMTEYLTAFGPINNTDQLAKIFRMSPAKIETVLKDLIEVGWVIQVGHDYQSVMGGHTTANDVPMESIRKFHVSAMAKASEEIHRQDVEVREFQAAVLSFSQQDTVEAKKMIREFVSDFNIRFYNESKCDSIYQLSLQFVKLTEDTIA